MTVTQVLEDVGNETIAKLQKNLDEKTASKPSGTNSSFNLRQSIDYNVKRLSNGGIIWSLSMDAYYVFVDKGRKAGKYAPVDAIREYVTNKGLKLKESMKSKSKATALKPKASDKPKNKAVRAKSSLSKSIKDRNTLAFLINRKLKEKGSKGNNFYSNVINTAWINDFTERLAEAGLKEIDLEFDILINGN